MSQGQMRDWSTLPVDMLELIVVHLKQTDDRVRFSAVCKIWQSSVLSNCHILSRHLLTLMLPSQAHSITRDFFCLCDHKTMTFDLPQIQRKWCIGSSQGWLVTVDQGTKVVELLNPFSKCTIQLPSVPAIDEPGCAFSAENNQHILKVALSTDPILNPRDCVVMAITYLRNKLIFCKLGDKEWMTLGENEQIRGFEDVIFYKQQFYAMRHGKRPVLAWNVLADTPTMTVIAKRDTDIVPGRTVLYPSRRYLVESCGELLVVKRNTKWIEYENENSKCITATFEVFKLDEGSEQWTQVKCLGDRMIFLGNNCSASLSACDFPPCKGNCIYFTDDYREGYHAAPEYGWHDVGVYNLEDGMLESCYPNPPIWENPTIWIIPNRA